MAFPALPSPIKTLAVVAMSVAVIAAACTSDDEPDTSSDAGAQQQAAPQAQAVDIPGTDAEVAAVGSRFAISRVDRGTKPDIVFDSEGTPLIAYMLEREGDAGWVKVANADGSNVQLLQSGYLYGPLDIEAAPDGRVVVGYHDHDNEDGAIAVRNGNDWSVSVVPHDGHDGWDSAVAYGLNGEIYYLGIDPSQFGSASGVELATLKDDVWTVREIGSGPQPYEWGVDLATTSDGAPVALFFDSSTRNLVFGVDQGRGFVLNDIFTQGDAGRFAVMALDDNDLAHVAFFQSDSDVADTGLAPGNIIYGAQAADSTWSFEIVGSIDNQILGHTDARRTVAIALNGDEPVIAYIDTQTLTLATRNSSEPWTTEIVAESDGNDLQVVGLALDGSGRSHLTYSTVTSNGPLDGEVWYAAPAS
jgi:ribosomal protein S18 acetylase RimI-like enzyme